MEYADGAYKKANTHIKEQRDVVYMFSFRLGFDRWIYCCILADVDSRVPECKKVMGL